MRGGLAAEGEFKKIRRGWAVFLICNAE